MTTKKENTVVIIVDDGSPVTEHLDWIRSQYPTIKCVRKSENGGIAKCKNTCLRELHEAGCDVFFLFDDDFRLLQTIEDKYVAALQEENVYVLSGTTAGNAVVGEFTPNTVKTQLLNGFLLSFTAKTFMRAGYFKIFPEKYGHEHTWYTYQIMHITGQPAFLNISDHRKYYKFEEFLSSVEEHVRERELAINEAALNMYLSELSFLPCVE